MTKKKGDKDKMKIIEALKKVKELEVKTDDLRSKVGKYCADLDYETPAYGATQKDQVKEWIQSHHDILKEISKLKISIQQTNLATPVTIELGGKPVTHSIAEWILRRRELATKEYNMWSALTDRGLKETSSVMTSNQEKKEVKIRRYFDPKERDVNIDLYRTEPSIIDRTLEVTNAITDIIE